MPGFFGSIIMKMKKLLEEDGYMRHLKQTGKRFVITE